MQEILVNRLGSLRLPRKSVVRLTDCLYMTTDVYPGRNTTTTTTTNYSAREGQTVEGNEDYNGKNTCINTNNLFQPSTVCLTRYTSGPIQNSVVYYVNHKEAQLHFLKF